MVRLAHQLVLWPWYGWDGTEPPRRGAGRSRLLDRPAEVVHSLLAHGGVAGAVGDEESVVPLLLDVPVPRHHRQLPPAPGHPTRPVVTPPPLCAAASTAAAPQPTIAACRVKGCSTMQRREAPAEPPLLKRRPGGTAARRRISLYLPSAASVPASTHLDALGDERADDVVLDAAVNGHNVHVPAPVRLRGPAASHPRRVRAPSLHHRSPQGWRRKRISAVPR